MKINYPVDLIQIKRLAFSVVNFLKKKLLLLTYLLLKNFAFLHQCQSFFLAALFLGK